MCFCSFGFCRAIQYQHRRGKQLVSSSEETDEETPKKWVRSLELTQKHQETIKSGDWLAERIMDAANKLVKESLISRCQGVANSHPGPNKEGVYSTNAGMYPNSPFPRGTALGNKLLPVSEDQLFPRTSCPPGHMVLGPTVPPDAWS